MYSTDLEVLKHQVIVETYRSSGPGGQRKNKTETAVRLKHPLSGITVSATEHRSQALNFKLAFERLRERLIRLNRPKKRRIPTSVSRADPGEKDPGEEDSIPEEEIQAGTFGRVSRFVVPATTNQGVTGTLTLFRVLTLSEVKKLHPP